MEFQVVEKVYVKAQELRSIIEEKQFVLKSSTSDVLICIRLPVDLVKKHILIHQVWYGA